jgi:nucleoside-triphosphatase THEP1
MTVCERMRRRKIRGFFSQILWDGDQRNGWRLDTFDGDGDGGVLARMDIHSQHNMGRYGVEMLLLERLVDSQLQFDSEVYVYLVDEIGIIAPWSPKFVFAMDEILDSSQKVIATIHVSGDGYVQQVNDSSDVGL